MAFWWFYRGLLVVFWWLSGLRQCSPISHNIFTNLLPVCHQFLTNGDKLVGFWWLLGLRQCSPICHQFPTNLSPISHQCVTNLSPNCCPFLTKLSPWNCSSAPYVFPLFFSGFPAYRIPKSISWIYVGFRCPPPQDVHKIFMKITCVSHV